MGIINDYPSEPMGVAQPRTLPVGGALTAHGLSAWYGANDARREVFSALSLSVEPGCVLAVFGPNGCGKTTLLRVLAGIEACCEGSVKWPGCGGRPPRVAWVPQLLRGSFFGWASLRTNVAMGSAETVGELRRARAGVDSMCAKLGIDLDLDLLPSACSDGMLQQAGLLRALCRRPEVLFADEPFCSLDLGAARVFRRALREYVTLGAVAAVVVLHDIESVVEIADRVLVIPGRPYSSDAREGFAQAVTLENRWLGRAGSAAGAELPLVELMQRVLGAVGGDG